MTVRLPYLALLLTACGLDSVEIGVIHYDRGQPRIEATTPARVGDSAFMTVWTVGGGCISLDSTEIVVTDEGGDFTPYDRDSNNSGCTADLRYLAHEGSFTFATPGRKVIRVHGRHNGELIEIPVTITIQ